MAERQGCAETRELIPELAAGGAAGDERARALRHLTRCPECRRELAAVAEVVDGLLLLASEREPPAGFESAVMGRLALPAPRGRRRRVVALWAASIVVVAALATGGLWLRTAGDRELAASYRQTLAVSNGTYFRAVPLVATGSGRTGTVVAYQGSPSWIFITVATATGSGRYDVHLIATDGRRYVLGGLDVQRGKGSLGSTIDVQVHQILIIELLRAGTPSLTARFT